MQIARYIFSQVLIIFDCFVWEMLLFVISSTLFYYCAWCDLRLLQFWILLLTDLSCNHCRNAVSHWRVMALNSPSKSTHLKRLVLWQTNSKQTTSLLLLRWAFCSLALCIYLKRCTTFAANPYWCNLICLTVKRVPLTLWNTPLSCMSLANIEAWTFFQLPMVLAWIHE